MHGDQHTNMKNKKKMIFFPSVLLPEIHVLGDRYANMKKIIFFYFSFKDKNYYVCTTCNNSREINGQNMNDSVRKANQRPSEQ